MACLEAAMIARRETGLDGVEAWSKLRANYSRRTLERVFRAQREFTYPNEVKDLSLLTAAIMQCQEMWKKMMTELGGGAKIPDLWRMSA